VTHSVIRELQNVCYKIGMLLKGQARTIFLLPQPPPPTHRSEFSEKDLLNLRFIYETGVGVGIYLFLCVLNVTLLSFPFTLQSQLH